MKYIKRLRDGSRLPEGIYLQKARNGDYQLYRGKGKNRYIIRAFSSNYVSVKVMAYARRDARLYKHILKPDDTLSEDERRIMEDIESGWQKREKKLPHLE